MKKKLRQHPNRSPPTIFQKKRRENLSSKYIVMSPTSYNPIIKSDIPRRFQIVIDETNQHFQTYSKNPDPKQ